MDAPNVDGDIPRRYVIGAVSMIPVLVGLAAYAVVAGVRAGSVSDSLVLFVLAGLCLVSAGVKGVILYYHRFR